ncbi:MAG TPA: DinB family protein [Thermoanaerobaculia bacterium]|nr:DinB family protein [Thermoanaerobaculia bacterium]
MKRIIPMALALVFALSAFPDEVPQTDHDKVVHHLELTQMKFLGSVRGLSEAQWKFKPAPERWSIAEVAEHITAAESLLRGMAADAMKTKLDAPANQDEKVTTAVVDRSKKFKAPEPLVPTNRFTTPEATIAEFRKQRAETIKLAASDVDLRGTGAKHFLFGPLDTSGWLLFLSAHSARHTLQIEEVKADPNFPKE